MRVSTDKMDFGYVPDAYNYRVFLDGVELLNCVTADEELGEAHCFEEPHRVDKDGTPALTELRGVVRIERSS
jgi:hypothetical protein